jgi:hypothetical protein
VGCKHSAPQDPATLSITRHLRRLVIGNTGCSRLRSQDARGQNGVSRTRTGPVADLGIGAAHDGPTPTTESLSAALRTTLTLQDPRTSDRRGRHDPHRRGDGGSDAAARRAQRRNAARRSAAAARRRTHRRATVSASKIVLLGVLRRHVQLPRVGPASADPLR